MRLRSHSRQRSGRAARYGGFTDLASAKSTRPADNTTDCKISFGPVFLTMDPMARLILEI